jgi:hypothetical protein
MTTLDTREFFDYGVTVIVEAKAAEFAAELVRQSIVFKVIPLPDDSWSFRFKDEAIRPVNIALERTRIRAFPKFGG